MHLTSFISVTQLQREFCRELLPIDEDSRVWVEVFEAFEKCVPVVRVLTFGERRS